MVLLALALQAESILRWDRQLEPGLTFRMETQRQPARNAYGLKVSFRNFRAESWLAGKTVYEPGAANGRATVSQMVRESNAVAGVNGDFFQWGNDPGGDPQGLMMQRGVFLSHPQTASRSAALGWGPRNAYTAFQPTWQAWIELPDGTKRNLDQFNGRVDDNRVGYSDASAGSIYSPVTATLIRLRLSGDARSASVNREATVTEVGPLQGRPSIPAGEAVLVAAGSAQTAVASLKPQDRIRLRWSVEGPLGGVTDVMGGGPILLRDGEYVGPKPGDSFSDTRHPRTAVGRTADGSIWYVVIDGRQSMSVGASLPETAALLKAWGCRDAINLDGGGSSAINAFGMTLNRPSGGVERAVANGIVLHRLSRPNQSVPAADTQLELPRNLAVGSMGVAKLRHRGRPVRNEDVIWTAQGSGWIDQDGTLRAHAAGKVTVNAWFRGRVVRGELEITQP